MTMKAQVHDIAPAHFRRMTKMQEVEPQAAPSILDDFADAVEAVHQVANLAGFSERPRAFVLALASAARSRESAQVELYDEELADLQNCSAKTVQRQRADYFAEARRAKLDLIGIVEGEYNKGENKNAPTLYRFHLGGAVERIVTRARSSSRWHEDDRQKQREAIAQAATLVFDEIPRSNSHSRKKRRPRPAAAEIETCLKMAASKLHRAQEIASKLPPRVRAELLGEDDPRELRKRWLELRAEMDALFDDSPQSVEGAQVDEGGGQFVRESDADDQGEPQPSAEAEAAWERTFAGLTDPPVHTVEIALRESDGGLSLKDVPSETEVRERIAVLVESGALDEESARGFEELAHDPLTREVFARRYMEVF